MISKLCSAENNTCQSEETSELSHTELLYCLSSHKYIILSIIMTPCTSLFSLASSYGDLQLLAQLVNTKSHLSINIMNVHTQVN